MRGRTDEFKGIAERNWELGRRGRGAESGGVALRVLVRAGDDAYEMFAAMGYEQMRRPGPRRCNAPDVLNPLGRAATG